MKFQRIMIERASTMKILSIFLALIMLTTSGITHAMTCSQFNALGTGHNITDAQASEFIKVFAEYAGNLSGFLWFSKRGKALKLAQKSGALENIARETLGVTKHFCEKRPNEPMKKIAIEQIDFFLDAIAKRNNL